MVIDGVIGRVIIWPPGAVAANGETYGSSHVLTWDDENREVPQLAAPGGALGSWVVLRRTADQALLAWRAAA